MRKTSSQYSVFSYERIPMLTLLVATFMVVTAMTLATFAGAQNGQQPAPSTTSPAASDKSGSPSGAIAYPPTKKVDQVDDYFGTKVPDPYRWLEDERSPETAAWVEAENKVTFAYLDKIAYRPQLKARLEKLLNYPRISAPSRRGDWFFFTKNDGLQNQSVWYMQKGLDGKPDLLIDPNKLSTDGTSRLAAFSLSKEGKYLVYGVSQGGSDWSDIYVMDVATRQTLSDHLQWIKASGVSWRGDEGFYYSRYPAPEKGKEMTTKNEFQAVYFHKVGTSQPEDELVYDDKEHPQRRHLALRASAGGRGGDEHAIGHGVSQVVVERVRRQVSPAEPRVLDFIA